MHAYVRIPCTNYLTHAGSGSMCIQSTSRTRLAQLGFNAHFAQTRLGVDAPNPDSMHIESKLSV